MKKKLYYVVENQVCNNELNGIKDITVYSITDNKPTREFVIETDISDNSRQVIKDYLEDNGMGDDEFELIQL